MNKEKIVVIGAGKVGTALAESLKQKGYLVTGLFNSSSIVTKEAEIIIPKANIIFITTPDNSIKSVCENLVQIKLFNKDQTIYHTSGALTSDILQAAQKLGSSVGSIHPLQTFADKKMALQNLPGSLFAVEGDKRAVDLASQIVADLGGAFFPIEKEKKPLYHAAACIASNYLVTLVDVSLELLEKVEIPRDKGWAAIFPLIQGTLNNINNFGTVKALTGPIARGDDETIRQHLDLIGHEAPELLEIYKILGLKTNELAILKENNNQHKVDSIKNMLKEEGYVTKTCNN